MVKRQEGDIDELLRAALRQEGHVYRRQRLRRPPSVRRAMFNSRHPLSAIGKLKHVLWIIGDVKLLQQSQVLASEILLGMMLLLIADVRNDRVQMRVRIGECAKAFLPIELASDPSLAIDEFA